MSDGWAMASGTGGIVDKAEKGPLEPPKRGQLEAKSLSDGTRSIPQ